MYYWSLLLSKAPFISEQFIYFMASTFKPNGSLSSTDEKQRKDELQRLESESDFRLKSSSHPKSGLPVNQAHLSTFPFTQLSTAHVCFTEQIVWAAKLNATCKIECVQHPPGFLEEKCLDPPHTSILLIGNFHDIKRYLPVDR